MTNLTSKIVLVLLSLFAMPKAYGSVTSSGRPWMRCVTGTASITSASSTTASNTTSGSITNDLINPISPSLSLATTVTPITLPTTILSSSGPNYGFVFKTERNNSNAVSVDTYLLSGTGSVIKQVGHAEASSTGSLTGNASSGLSIQSSSDSPSNFVMNGSVLTDSKKASATISTLGLFAGQPVTNLTVQCHLNLQNY